MNRELIALLEGEQKKTVAILGRVKKEMKRMPDGRLEVSKTGGKYRQYIRVLHDKGTLKRKYIGKKEIGLAQRLAQKEYDEKLRCVAETLVDTLSNLAEALKQYDIEKVYAEESEARRELIIPVIPNDEQFIRGWYEEHPGNGNSYEMITSYTTLRGEKVRSKSEKMIADAYYTASIPYVYEPALHLRTGRTVYPDFAVLDTVRRRTMYHEHFGLMDDEEYRVGCIRKIRSYNDAGLWSGETMIYTFEGGEVPFDQEELERMIEKYFR